MAKRYYFKISELNNIFSELQKYNVVQDPSTNARERGETIKQWALNNGFNGSRDAQSYMDFVQNYVWMREASEFNWDNFAEIAAENEERFEENRQLRRQQREQQASTSHSQKASQSEQDKIVEDIVESLTEYANIDLSRVVELDRNHLEITYDYLLEYMRNEVGRMSANEAIYLEIDVMDTEWGPRTLILTLSTRGKYETIIDELESKSYFQFLNMKDFQQNAFGSDSVITAFPLVLTIQAIRVKEAVGENYRTREGNLFKYVATVQSEIILKELRRCQIYQDVESNINEFKESCFVYALRELGVDKKIISALRAARITDDYLMATKIEKLFDEFNISGIVFDMDDETRHHNTVINTGNDITINLYKKHYFAHFQTGITTSWLSAYLHKNGYHCIGKCEHLDQKMLDTVNEENYNQRFRGGYWKKETNANRFLTSRVLVKTLMEHGAFRDMTISEFGSLPVLANKSHEILDISYNEKHCIRTIHQLQNKKKSKGVNPQLVFFADTEADVSEYHRVYQLVCQNFRGDDIRVFNGEDCCEKFLDDLPDNALVYFHFASYDVNFIMKYFKSAEPIKNGGKLITVRGLYNKKHITIRDSYSLITTQLKNFPKMFKLKTGEKEAFPYTYYTVERFTNKVGNIEEAAKHCVDPQQFLINIDKVKCRLSDTEFDMVQYCEFYCKQDVNILREGFLAFRNLCLDSFEVDVFNVLTAASLANTIMERNIYSKADIKYVGGIVKEYLSRSIYGGRCMCALNKKWRVKIPIMDFDACSLYPSAMCRMAIPLGAPKVLTKEQCNKEFLDTCDLYFVSVHISKVNRHHIFPLLPKRTKEGIEWNDVLPEGGITQEFSKIFLEDLIKFSDIEYEIIRGYYWNNGVDTSIQKFMKSIYDMRRHYKKEGNPLQEIYKLIMNSSYGKTIQKFKDTKIRIVDNENVNKFIAKNYNSIISGEKIYNGNSTVFKMRRAINNQFTPSIIGIICLDMSKRIMNEVMVLAEEIGCYIYYQDTDSMHIEIEDIPKLEAAYKQKYNRELIGKDVGQFHGDFDSELGEVKYAFESVFIRKKLYADKLLLTNGKIDYHYRAKGFTQKSIKREATKIGGIMELYDDVYNGNAHNIDLVGEFDNKFKQGNDFSIKTLTSFTRTVESVYEEGKRDDYFGYLHRD